MDVQTRRLGSAGSLGGCFLPGSGEAAVGMFASSLLLSDRERKKNHLKLPNSNGFGASRMPGPRCPGESHSGASLRTNVFPLSPGKALPTPAEGVDFKTADFLPFLLGLQVFLFQF